jgi:4-amino-4-deoxy-L-arabinose transferase-like glycosyltransferase
MTTSTLASERRSLATSLPPVALPLLASALAWGLLFAALPPPRQDFPLNDDWAFARGAFAFARGEGIHYGGWASMPQLGQWLEACPFVWLLGESHVALRLATVALSWLGLLAFNDLLRQEGLPRPRAALATAALAFNPLFFLLQGTFMTDVPALALALAALALYGRALRRRAAGWLAAGCAVAVLAVATRQNTAVVPAAAALLLARDPALRRRAVWWLGVLLPGAAAAAIHLWFQARPDVRPLQPSLPAVAGLLPLPLIVLHLAGLSALPVLLLEPALGGRRRLVVAFVLMLAGAGCLLGFGAYLPYGGLFPYTENMLTPWGAFAGSRFTGSFMVGHRPLLLGTPLRVLLTLLGCAGATALVIRGIAAWRPGAWASPLFLFTALGALFLLIVPDLYDRYLLFLLPGALALAARPAQPLPASSGSQVEARPRWLFALAGVALMGGVAVGLMHDWLAWNSARWELGRRAVTRHLDPLDVEGGVEWDAWFAGVGDVPARPAGPRWPVLPFTRDWFPAIRGRYALSFSELRGARRVDAEPYTLWLLPGQYAFFLLELPPLPERAGGQPRP